MFQEACIEKIVRFISGDDRWDLATWHVYYINYFLVILVGMGHLIEKCLLSALAVIMILGMVISLLSTSWSHLKWGGQKIFIVVTKNICFRLERWVASAAGSQYSYGRQNTYQRTISQDSNANSVSARSESDTFINCQKTSNDSQWLVGPTPELTTAPSRSPQPPPRKFVPHRPPHSSLTPATSTTPRSSLRSLSPISSTLGRSVKWSNTIIDHLRPAVSHFHAGTLSKDLAFGNLQSPVNHQHANDKKDIY